MSIVRSRPWARLCITVLCVTVFVTRLSGAHLHVCLDGSEAPESMKLTIVGINDGNEETRKARHDLDLSLAGEAVDQKLDGTLVLPVLLVADTIFFILKLVETPNSESHGAPSINASPVFRWRPPLRAPPRQLRSIV